MRIDCVYSSVCQIWVNQIRDNGGYYVHRCGECEYYLPRKDLTRCITGYTRTVRKFLEVIKDESTTD